MSDGGISIVVDMSDFGRVADLVTRLSAFDASELMSSIGALGESQTRRRITDEKTGPDGTPWPANRAGTPILVQSGEHLLASIAWTSSGEEAEWGAWWERAHVHQDGMTIKPKTAKALRFPIAGGEFAMAKQVTIPARPFVGLSDANIAEITAVVTDVFGAVLS